MRNRLQTDPFFVTRLQLMLLYIAVGTIVFVVLGWFVSGVRFQPVLQLTSATQAGSAAQIAYAAYRQELLYRRFLLVIIFVASSYFLTEFALRSIRTSVQLQRRFFGAVSHELRTPLTIMKNTAEVALRNANGDPVRLRRVVESMLEETDRMTSTMQFLLSLTSLSLQKGIPDVQTLSLTTIARSVLKAHRATAATVGVALAERLDGEGLVRGNEAALYGLLQNLIANALKHTPHGGTVTVAVVTSSRGTELQVRDTGTGIARADLPYIFEPFYQGGRTHGAYPAGEGFGLGLTLVREVARLHHARVSVESAVDAGTTFTVVFPLL